jgi:flagellar transcriptional activator FlhD
MSGVPASAEQGVESSPVSRRESPPADMAIRRAAPAVVFGSVRMKMRAPAPGACRRISYTKSGEFPIPPARAPVHHACHADEPDQESTQPRNAMNAESMMEEIRDANLTYLMLAQALIRKDRAQALYRLGLSEQVADLIASLSNGQILKIAASNMLMCRFRFDDEVVWGLLSGSGRGNEVSGVHAAILMSGRLADPAGQYAKAA